MILDKLSHYFDGLAFKRLSAVEASRSVSNQHEFNGVTALKELLGSERRAFAARFVYLDDGSDGPLIADAELTWYDARASHPTRSEYRLYFPDTPVAAAASEGDLLVIARRPDDSVLVVITPAGSSAENQILWLFDVPGDPVQGIQLRALNENDTRLTAARALILEQIGVEVEKSDDAFLDRLVGRFPDGFPATREFSSFARETLPEVSGVDSPDLAVIAWWDREELLFKTLERHLVGERLRQGFDNDVDSFIAYSLSVHQTRKSRAGRALENHVEHLFNVHQIRHVRGAFTENRASPDFLFPGRLEYHNANYPADRLTMLGVKSTCKDRWRQILSEAARINEKHLFTLEPGISVAQTDEMQANRLRLVLPKGLHETYRESQRPRLMTLSEFIGVVRKRQG